MSQRPIQEIGAVLASTVYGIGIDEPVIRFTSSDVYYFYQDHEGSVTHVLNGGTLVEQYRYDAFGAPTIRDGSGHVIGATAIGNRFMFTGREWAPMNLGFYEYRARAYHPGVGRFMSEDPKLFDAGDYNLFRYCHNDPEDLTDPMGLAGDAPVTCPTCIGSLEREWRYLNNLQHALGWSGGAIQMGQVNQAIGQLSQALGGLHMGQISGRSGETKGRSLTESEKGEAKTVFHDKINYDPVRVINAKYVPWQSKNVAITPNGNIYYPKAPADFVFAGGAMVQLFIHEMTHVMQYQHGVDVLGKGLLLQTAYYGSFGTYNPYHYNYNPSRAFSSYNIEQQGEIARSIYTGALPNNIDYSDLR